MGKRDIATWEPLSPIKSKIVSEGWGSEVHCPHCKELATMMIVKLVKDLGIWWLCECGEGITLEQGYENYKEQGHIHSLGYYRNCAWKIQEKLWPIDFKPPKGETE